MIQKGKSSRAGRGKWETSFAAFRGIDCGETSWRASRCVNSRVSRKMRCSMENTTMESTRWRGGAFTASTYVPTFRGRSVVQPGFPDLFRSRPASVSLPPFLSFSVSPFSIPTIIRLRESGPDDFLHRLFFTDDDGEFVRGCFAVYLLGKTLTNM